MTRSTLSWAKTLGAMLMAAQLVVSQTANTPPPLTDAQKARVNRTVSVGYILFPGFEPLDVFGPLEILFSMSFYYNMSLALIAKEAGPVDARPPPHQMAAGAPPMDLSYMINPQVVATHTFENAPKLDLLLVPGGTGNLALAQHNDTSVERFIASRFNETEYVLSVCTGAVTLARSGILDGLRATSNKGAWVETTTVKSMTGGTVTWVPSARWVENPKVWTSSGVAAGMDMMYAFMKMYYGETNVDTLMNNIEYAPHTDASWDPFSVVHNVPGANKTRSLADCVGPVGYD
ncbi:hypothetical protein SEUCBS140593_001705 [Sporothrix eucalyptigena]|uniref:DJ-1/PfpI domain-containing protein n=1 Tax=Sporothrix eucalyptigena TaxID=1812306 RepID=A0ABP0B0S6_9PEZI